LSPRLRSIVVPLLIVLGIQCWLIFGRSDFARTFQLWLLAGAVVVSIIPPINRTAVAAIDRVRSPSVKVRYIAAGVIASISAAYLVETAWFQGRNFQPKWQDELSYIVQFQQLATGRLWMPRHALADFFDSFQLIVDPVYASMYFPGASLFYVWATLLKLPYWLITATMCGATVGLIYLIMSELLDGWWGLLAVAMVLGTSMFRKLAIMIGGHPPSLLLEMLMIWSWLSWRRDRRAGWLIMLGIASGWAAITRPLDAVVVALPIGLMMLLDLWGSRTRAWLAAAACVIFAAAPFLVLQIVVNVGITGSWMRTPFDLYATRDYPGTTLGFHQPDPARRPVSQLPQKQKYHDVFTAPAIERHQPGKLVANWLGRDLQHPGDLQRLFILMLPHPLFFLLLPAGMMGLFDRRRWCVWLILPAFIVLYSFYTFSLPHYAIITLPAVVLTALMGAVVISDQWRGGRAALTTLVSLFILIMSVTETAEANRIVADELFEAPPLAGISQTLKNLPHKPAVVLFRFDPKNVPDEEPVYNIDAAWPDDAPVIRAHDLGTRNAEIFRYYAKQQPERAFYLYGRGDDSITFLGFARELGRNATTTPTEHTETTEQSSK